MHDATKWFNELEGDFKKSPIGEYANRVRRRRPDQSDRIKCGRATDCLHNSGTSAPEELSRRT